MDIEKIGKFIKELRIENNLSQNQLSEIIHVTRQAISNWENGKAIPDSNILITLSSLFNVSINEILSGQRQASETSLEEITLNLVDENNKKKEKMKRMIAIFSLSFSILLITFLGYYFITNYNSIKVYKIKGENETFKTYNGILVTTKFKSYLRLGKVDQFVNNNKADINKIKIYYINSKNKEVILLETQENDLLVKDESGYSEYCLNKEIKSVINNLYLEINYDSNRCDLIHLELKEDFKNNFNFFRHNPKPKIIRKNNEKSINISETNTVKENPIIEEIMTINEEKTRLNQQIREAEINKEKIVQKEDNKEQITDLENKTSEQTTSIIEEKNIIIETPDILPSPEENNDKEEENNLKDNEDIEEDEKTDIDYEKIVDIIKSNFQEQYGTYQYFFTQENKYYQLILNNEIVEIDIVQDNTIDCWQIFKDNSISYQAYTDYIEMVTITAEYNEFIETNNEYFNKLKEEFETIHENIQKSNL